MACLVPNVDRETKKQKEHDLCEIKIQQDLLYGKNKNITRL